MRKLLCQTFLAFAVAFTAAQTATADDLECTGAVGEILVDNVIVPPGATCSLDGTRVEGNIKVGINATLFANAARVGGNVEGDGFSAVFLSMGTEVLGNVELRNGGRGDIRNSIVRENVQFENNQGKLDVQITSIGGSLQAFHNSGKLRILSNPIIGGDLHVFAHFGRIKIHQNRTDQDLQAFSNIGVVTLKNNQIRGNLQCKENNPSVVESNNAVGGNRECEP